MFKFTIGVILFHTFLIFIEGDSFEVDEVKELSLKVSNGSASPNSIPYQAYINSTTLRETRSCSGSLISQNYILTVAQCIDEAIFIQIWLGTNNVSSQGGSLQKLESINYTIHENYNRSTLEYNIGVIFVANIEINEAVGIVELPSRQDVEDAYEDAIVTVSGWGQLDETQRTSDILLVTNSRVVPDLICWEAFGYFYMYEICTLAEGGACYGDIGGPIVIGGKLIAVVSHVKDTCKQGYSPNTSIKTTLFLDWIQNHTDLIIS